HGQMGMGMQQPMQNLPQSGMMAYAQPQPQQHQQPQPMTRGDGSFVGAPPLGIPAPVMQPQQQLHATGSVGIRADHAPVAARAAGHHITRSRAYSFVLDARG